MSIISDVGTNVTQVQSGQATKIERYNSKPPERNQNLNEKMQTDQIMNYQKLLKTSP